MPDNLITTNTIYEAFGKGDIPGIIEHLSEELQWEQWADNSSQKAGVPWMKFRKGKQGALEFFGIMQGLRITDFQILSIMSNESQVAVELVIEADVLATGGHFRDEEIHLLTFDDQGKVIRLRHYTDTAKHMAAAKANN